MDYVSVDICCVFEFRTKFLSHISKILWKYLKLILQLSAVESPCDDVAIITLLQLLSRLMIRCWNELSADVCHGEARDRPGQLRIAVYICLSFTSCIRTESLNELQNDRNIADCMSKWWCCLVAENTFTFMWTCRVAGNSLIESHGELTCCESVPMYRYIC